MRTLRISGTTPDHAVSTWLLPAGPQATAVRVWWLVRESAVEGRDYDLAKRLLATDPEQDWVICERAARDFPAYHPIRTDLQEQCRGFVNWYLNFGRTELNGGPPMSDVSDAEFINGRRRRRTGVAFWRRRQTDRRPRTRRGGQDGHHRAGAAADRRDTPTVRSMHSVAVFRELQRSEVKPEWEEVARSASRFDRRWRSSGGC
jgi:hypothetical protein